MAMSRRLWRVMRGLGRSVGDSFRRPSREERDAREELEEAMAERAARAEVEGLGVPPPAPAGLSDAVASSGSDRLAELPGGTACPGPATTFSLPQRQAPADPALAPHYAVLELPAGATLEQIEHAYRRLKAQLDPAQCANDPLKLARARQQEARLDEAYLSLRQALVPVRRL